MTTRDDTGRPREGFWTAIFDPRITLGNILTIIGGVVTAIMFFAYVSLSLATRLDRIEGAITDIRCTLAAQGIAPTTTQCVLPALRMAQPK